jgi:hypothetical protein
MAPILPPGASGRPLGTQDAVGMGFFGALPDTQ